LNAQHSIHIKSSGQLVEQTTAYLQQQTKTHSNMKAAALVCACGLVQQTAGFIVPASRPATALAASSNDKSEKVLTSWRDKVDLLLNPRLSLSERQILTKDLLNDLPDIRDDVQAAASKGGARAVLNDVILAPGTEARRAVAGIRAVQRQLKEDLLPELQKELRAASSDGNNSTRARISALLNEELPKALEKAIQDLPQRLQKADFSPQALMELNNQVREEVLNAVSRTPSGLYTPPYELIESGPIDEERSLPQYEIRKYGRISLATATMQNSGGSSSAAASGDAFNTLAGYLFGANVGNRAMQMTTPVTIDVSRADSDAGAAYGESSNTSTYQRMSFVLPEGVSAQDAPSPVDGKVMLREVAEQLVAAR
jgi:SOUL heme-binding protein